MILQGSELQFCVLAGKGFVAARASSVIALVVPIVFATTMFVTTAVRLPQAETQTTAATQAFEGYGAVTRGAASAPGGFTTVHVTSLADSGPGSLRAAVSQGNRRIVFDVGGTITLASHLRIEAPYITIDGATAPAPGITIIQLSGIQTSVRFTHDVVITHLRMRGQGGHPNNAADIWGINGELRPASKIVLDHITAYAAEDGIFDIWGDVSDVTISNSMLLDTLMTSNVHGPPPYGSTIQQRITYYRNLFTGNNERQVRLRYSSRDIDYVNNIIYGWGWEADKSGIGLDIHNDGDAWPTPTRINVEGNLFHFVSDNPRGSDTTGIDFVHGPNVGQVYFANNVLPAGTQAVSTGPRTSMSGLSLEDPASLPADLLPDVGAHHRTAAENGRLNAIGDAGPSNRLPALTNPGDQIAVAGTPVTLVLHASDPDGDAVHFEATGLPPGLAINGTTGIISGVIAGAATDSPYAISAAASDGALSATVDFTWTVFRSTRQPFPRWDFPRWDFPRWDFHRWDFPRWEPAEFVAGALTAGQPCPAARNLPDGTSRATGR